MKTINWFLGNLAFWLLALTGVSVILVGLYQSLFFVWGLTQ